MHSHLKTTYSTHMVDSLTLSIELTALEFIHEKNVSNRSSLRHILAALDLGTLDSTSTLFLVDILKTMITTNKHT